MESIWQKTYKNNRKRTSALQENVQADVAVIGGGMAGILTAWQLKQSGKKVVLLEAKEIGSGQTKNTTAKITAQHGLYCHDFLSKKGEKVTRDYVQANLDAIREYKTIIQEEGIDCDFREMDAYVYSTDYEALIHEVEAARLLEIDASYVEKIEIPVSCAGAVCFHGQAQFHPLQFIEALAKQLTIYENTKVTEVEEHLVKTVCGSVEAENIVFATHFPFINFPGMYFARMHQERSYVIALEHAGNLNGMYIGEEKDSYSFRQYDKYILFGGEGHRTGENREEACYERLREAAKRMYPESKVAAYWSAQDCITTDQIPFIGQYAVSRPNWFVATGFRKWGMTSSMVSAKILRDIICGKKNPYAHTFAPDRFSSQDIPQLIQDSGKSIMGLAKRFFHIPDETLSMIPIGHGAIIDTEEGKTGVYKREDGKIFQVDVVCPHLGCELAWNPADHSWDCPCHGSRFDYKGNLLDGPAQTDLK